MFPAVLQILLSLTPLLLAGGAIAVIVAARRSSPAEPEPGIGTLRRIFLYLLAFAGLAVTGLGAALLLGGVLEALSGQAVIAAGQTGLALGLALTIVGTPVWLVFWATAQRTVQRYPVEARSLARKLYVYLVLAGSAITAAGGGIAFLQWVLGTGDFTGTPPALVVVWTGVWAYHRLLERQEPPSSRVTLTTRRLYVYLMALLGLALLAVGTGVVLEAVMAGAYHSLFGYRELLAGSFALWDDPLRAGLATTVVGGLLWWWHWHREVRSDQQSVLKSVYLYLFAILTGAIGVVTGLSVALYHGLQWFVGQPETTSVVEHFDVFPGVIATVVAGGALWGYHWAVVRQETEVVESARLVARRVYAYLVTALGLVTLGVGMVMLVAVFLGLVGPAAGPTLQDGLWRNPLVLAVTLLAVGVPVWGVFWRGAQALATQGELAERSALPRRVFLFATFGASVLLVLVNLSIVLFNVFNWILGEQEASGLLWGIRWNVAIVLTAGAASGYYWLVLREDRAALAELPAQPAAGRPGETTPYKRVTAVVGPADLDVVRNLEGRLGYAITVWQRADGAQRAVTLSDADLAQLEAGVTGAISERVLLLVEPDGVRVIPFLPEEQPGRAW